MSFSQRLGWIGLDVGTHTVTLAQAVRHGARVSVHRAAVIQRPASWSGDDRLALEQPASSYPEIRAALECGGFSGRDVICSLPMNACLLRGLRVPSGSDHERRAMIADELVEEWAELRQPMEFDFWETDTLPGERGSESFNVSVLAASRGWVSQLWHDCRQSGLYCWAIDGNPLAIARAAALAEGHSGGQRLLAVDWGYSNTTFCVVGDGRPLYSRRVADCAFGRVLDAIAGLFDVSLDEAQHLADSQGIATGTKSRSQTSVGPASVVETAEHQGPATELAAGADGQLRAAIRDAAATTLEELQRQIARTLQFMEVQRRHLRPAAIWLMGGGASMPGIDAYLADALELPVHVWQLPAGDQVPCSVSGNRSALLASAVALSATAWRAA